MKETSPLLREVSRSFYLSLRVLPQEVRPQISLAYLLARASDTVADTRAVDRGRRLELLRRMRTGDFRSVESLAADQALPAEQLLLENLENCSQELSTLETADQKLILGLLDTIISGQIFDLERFPDSSTGSLIALSDEKELDEYTYKVAGCVGEFWTRICGAHLTPFKALDQEEMVRLGIRFGKGLQLVNILRDMAADLRMGRCYLPVQDPQALLDPLRRAELLPLYARKLDEALEHLDSGWRYALNIPAGLKRLRLACIWPIWIGLETIALMRRSSDPLDPAQRVMVPQWKVYLFLAQSFLYSGSNTLLDRAYRSLRSRASFVSMKDSSLRHPGESQGPGARINGNP
ncbi:MAG: phytoene/squalene synthase family protein [Elusimicrobiota bacterium]|jgi:farnesyl-diphosphate farnesyltransferase